MTTTSADEESLREDITIFLRRNFPQIKMHGGAFTIEHVDPTDGAVEITLTGACSGCGISPMTIQALKSRMVEDIPEITQVTARTGSASDEELTPSVAESSTETDSDDSDGGFLPEAPF